VVRLREGPGLAARHGQEQTRAVACVQIVVEESGGVMMCGRDDEALPKIGAYADGARGWMRAARTDLDAIAAISTLHGGDVSSGTKERWLRSADRDRLDPVVEGERHRIKSTLGRRGI
jgi:hypothetical protein